MHAAVNQSTFNMRRRPQELGRVMRFAVRHPAVCRANNYTSKLKAASREPLENPESGTRRQKLEDDVQSNSSDDTTQLGEQPSRLHTATLRGQYLDMIRSGAKTVEGRTFYGKFRDVRVGDMVRFVCNTDPGEQVSVRVTHVNVYPGFKEMLTTEGVSNCLPGVSSIDEATQIYHSFPFYQERSKQYGALALRFEMICSGC